MLLWHVQTLSLLNTTLMLEYGDSSVSRVVPITIGICIDYAPQSSPQVNNEQLTSASVNYRLS